MTISHSKRQDQLSGNRERAAETGKPIGNKALISTDLAGSDLFLQIVIEIVFIRVGPHLQRLDLQCLFNFDPGFDQFFGKNIVFSQEIMVFFEGDQGFLKSIRGPV
jgi:hypothetical protein